MDFQIQTSWRYGVMGLYVDRGVKTNLPHIKTITVRIYPIPFVRMSITWTRRG